MAEDGAQGRLSRPSAPLALRLANLALLVLYPLAWFAPLIRAGWLPLFSLSEISVVTGLQSLWRTDIPLALIVTVFALFAPKDAGVEHLKALALVSRTMRDAATCAKLRANDDPAALHAVLTEARGNTQAA